MKPKLILCLALVLSGNVTVSHADETNTRSSDSQVMMSFAVHGMTNNSTTTIAATNAAGAFANAVVSNYQNFILSSTNITPTNAVAALPMAAAYMKTNIPSILASSAAKEMGAAAEFLKKMKMQGRLPGMTQNGHATVTTRDLPISRFQDVAYPFSVTFHVVPLGDLSTNHYTVMRTSADAEWQLQKAWRTDTEGRTIKEWPLNGN